MKRIAALVLLFVASNAWALRGRPGSDLRFDGWGGAGDLHVASDGADFLVLSTSPEIRGKRLFTQKVVDGKPAGPRRQIGEGRAVSLAWAGTRYLAGWQNESGLWAAPVSRDGSLLATPEAPVASGNVALLATGRQSAMVFAHAGAQLTVRPLDLDGRPAGPAVTHAAPAHSAATAAAAVPGGFAAAFSGFGGTWLMLFRADGTAITNGPLLLDGPYGGTSADYHSTGAGIASDGTDILVVFGAGIYDNGGEVKSVVVSANGAIRSTQVALGNPAGHVHSFAVRGAVWDGSRYIVALSTRPQPYSDEIDAALLQIARGGERVGELARLVERPGSQIAAGLATNGRELLLPILEPIDWRSPATSAVIVNPATLQVASAERLGRTLAAQDELTLATGDNGYLAAWIERAGGVPVLRASRIDARGNYLDGEGILLADVKPFGEPEIAIDGRGTQWLVVWSDGQVIRGRFLSRGGAAAKPAFVIAEGSDAAVRWNGSHYVVLHTTHGSLHSTVLSAAGTASDTKLLLPFEEFSENGGLVWGQILYPEPELALLDNRLLAVFAKRRWTCTLGTPGHCGDEHTVMGLRLDDPNATPFVIAENTWGQIAVAESPSQTLVTWSQFQSLRGAFLSAAAPEQPGPSFVIDPRGTRSSAAFDGGGFLVAWWLDQYQLEPHITLSRITPSGAVSAAGTIPLDVAEAVFTPALAASPSRAALVGYITKHPAYDDVARNTLLLASEINDVPAPPPAPSVVCATKNADGTITVRWRSVPHAQGVQVELQLPDGTFRAVAVAAGDATSVRFALPGLEGDVLRIRAWNAGGLSAPSPHAQGSGKPRAELRWSATACAGVPVTIEIALSGTPPFTIHWRDGHVQSGIHARTATRTVTLTGNASFTIASLADASCATNETPETIRFDVAPQPAIVAQPAEVRVSGGQTATLTVETSDDSSVAWFEGAPGDTAKPVGTGARSFTTPPLTQSVRYWVRVSNRCGHADSQAMHVLVSGKRRAARR